ncbi:pyridoxal-dependent decarboxylase [Catellatospora chokoriensis]|uniref:Histidine decarboxylase n=1 Tax=Catellatospora chokoriensis TaxID=310353 RepID=A0A8J3JRN1_9ACTN|nr:pyridoxal-dependent decarboxylase [Catellatospora chokoriensis]GIF89837.1 histidine decarboxylase [Catellatospora chokoriensis]
MTLIPARDTGPTLRDLLEKASAGQRYNLAFPGATDLTHQILAELMTTQLLNNVGSPYDGGHGHNHTKGLEVEVVDMVGDMMRAPATRWGYVTGGSTECTEHALLNARMQFPDLVVYSSADAHYSVAKITRKLMLPFVTVASTPTGQMDLTDLEGELARRRDRPAMIVATAGTTVTEAVDDVAGITAICRRLALTRRRIHVDAALSGPPLALLPETVRPAFDFTAGATSIGISGHKSLGTLMPCGVIVYAEAPYAAAIARVSYTGTRDVTITGSRSGHTPLLLWSVLAGLGSDLHTNRFDAARQLAEQARARLADIGVDAQRNPHAFTVYFPPPPPELLKKWTVTGDERYSHIIVMPGTEAEQLDELVTDWQLLMRPVPAPRRKLARLLGTAATKGGP